MLHPSLTDGISNSPAPPSRRLFNWTEPRRMAVFVYFGLRHFIPPFLVIPVVGITPGSLEKDAGLFASLTAGAPCS
jgi:hypothetical protein